VDHRWCECIWLCSDRGGQGLHWVATWHFGYYSPISYWSINMPGYPGDKPNHCMWQSRCKTLSSYTDYQCDTHNYGGMSGSTVLLAGQQHKIHPQHLIMPSVVPSVTMHCTRITETKVGVLERWRSMFLNNGLTLYCYSLTSMHVEFCLFWDRLPC
jgi:hypothetical protein